MLLRTGRIDHPHGAAGDSPSPECQSALADVMIDVINSRENG